MGCYVPRHLPSRPSIPHFGRPAFHGALGSRLPVASGFLLAAIVGTVGARRAADAKPSIVITQVPAHTGGERPLCQHGRDVFSNVFSMRRIVVITPQQTPRVLSQGFHSACDPHVSFDGKQLLFAGKRMAQDNWDIYEIGVDGSGLRQITRSIGDCRHPGYQPDFYQISDANEAWLQITFVGTRAGEINEFGTAPLTSLYSCKLDGTGVQRLTHNLSSDSDPHITWDGRLVYASWQRRTLDHGPWGRSSCSA